MGPTSCLVGQAGGSTPQVGFSLWDDYKFVFNDSISPQKDHISDQSGRMYHWLCYLNHIRIGIDLNRRQARGLIHHWLISRDWKLLRSCHRHPSSSTIGRRMLDSDGPRLRTLLDYGLMSADTKTQEGNKSTKGNQ
jgi:hypothetical protein